MLAVFDRILNYLRGSPQPSQESSVDVVENSSAVERREHRGTITSIAENHGMIDHTIAFFVESLVGDEFPDVGDLVDVVATRRRRFDGWRAVRVRLVRRQWPDPEAEPEIDDAPQSLIGKISSITDVYGYVNGDRILFEFDALVAGYVPAVADWVKVDVKANPASEITWFAYRVEPLRVRSLCGRVRYFGAPRGGGGGAKERGYVGRDVYFHKSACVDGFVPANGESVRVRAVESGHKKSKWRALRVEPLVATSSVATDDGEAVESSFNHGIDVNQVNDVGEIFAGQVKVTSIPLKNGNSETVNLIDCSVLDGKVLVTVHAENASSPVDLPYKLSPGSSCVLQCSVFGCGLGCFWNKVSLRFDGFDIDLFINVQVVDPLEAVVAPVEPYRPQKRLGLGRGVRGGRVNEDRTLVVPGQRPQFVEVRLPRKLMLYDVPDSVREGFASRKDIFTILPVLAQPLSLRSYSQRFSALLYAEELEMERTIKQYAIPDAEMRQVGDYLKLVVPGLTERRPSLLVGDKVYASPPRADETVPHYEGFIHEIQGESVLLKFSNSFHKRFRNENYHVDFCFGRTPLRRCHQAVEFIRQIGSEFLFPAAVDPKPPVASVRLFVDLSAGLRPPDFLNDCLNTRQKEAVQRIVAARGRPAPYVVFGPPGTGKTVTLVEAILQVFYRIPFSRILVTAPSNSAADLLALRLCATQCFSQGDLARLNAYQRLSESPEALLPFCHTADELETFAYYRIVVTTCVSSGIFYSFGLQQDHFTHVFVDEAGQSTEPECLIPALYCAGQHGQCVLAGDPYQLGPVLMSKIANVHGLQLSLLERLTKRPAYRRNDEFASVGGFNPCLVTKLIDNYRSHRSILEVPSRLFYDAELRPCAPISRIGSLCNWPALPCQPNFPIIFHGIKGEDLREGTNPSWFNPAEAVQALKYALQLTGNGSDGPQLSLQCQDIGIITPYRKQVEKIRSLLERFGISDIKVGSVEEFQGQERRAIILSTVRSTSSSLSPNEHSCLGFVGNPKRFNVAITRAEALLIVIGNRQLLSKDSYWEGFVGFCEKHGACIGH